MPARVQMPRVTRGDARRRYLRRAHLILSGPQIRPPLRRPGQGRRVYVGNLSWECQWQVKVWCSREAEADNVART
eukprot:767178-Hanusia_phi.AAC.8